MRREQNKPKTRKVNFESTSRMSPQEIYEATRRRVSLSDELYEALVHAAKQAGVTPDKLLNDILCEHFRLDC